jgi:thioredoxin 2
LGGFKKESEMIVTCAECGTKNRVDERGGSMQPVCGKCGTSLPAVSTTPIIVSDATFGEVLKATTPVLLDCWAPWCGPCRMLTPTIDALAAESGGKYVVGKLNVDENPSTASRFNISSIPTMLIFHQGQLVERLVGLQPKAAIAGKLASVAGMAGKS